MVLPSAPVMLIKITCHCGKQFNTIGEARGKAVRCPGCGKILRVPANPPLSAALKAPPSGAAPASGSTAIETFLVRCKCGKTLKVRGSIGGQPVKCPGCGGPVELKPLRTQPQSSPALSKGRGSPCPVCPALVEQGSRVCVECGTNVPISQQIQAISPEQEEARKKKLFTMGMCVVIIVVVVGIMATRG